MVTTHSTFRFELVDSDIPAIRRITESTGFFSRAEIDVAVELAVDRRQKGPQSDYHFILAEVVGKPVAYATYGPIACTTDSFDLYWLVVDKKAQGNGWGRKLLTESEKQVRKLGGRRVYVETSNRELYVPTRAFYEHCDYRIEAILPDFYAPGDDKVIYIKLLDS